MKIIPYEDFDSYWTVEVFGSKGWEVIHKRKGSGLAQDDFEGFTVTLLDEDYSQVRLTSPKVERELHNKLLKTEGELKHKQGVC